MPDCGHLSLFNPNTWFIVLQCVFLALRQVDLQSKSYKRIHPLQDCFCALKLYHSSRSEHSETSTLAK